MTTAVLGLFAGFSDAQCAIRPLVAQGIRREDITLIANQESTSVNEVLAAAAWDVNVDVGPASRGEPAALIALGIPADEVAPYAIVLDAGGALVSVAAAEPQVDAVVELLRRSAPAELAASGNS